VHEFFAIVTHPRIYKPPTPPAAAIEQIEAWLESPSLVVIGEVEGYWRTLKPLLEGGLIAGAPVHDARIAALCLLHGVDELWSVDRDFSRFPGLKTQNPLVA
jgi:predicted nucleic acid-binding protein